MGWRGCHAVFWKAEETKRHRYAGAVTALAEKSTETAEAVSRYAVLLLGVLP